MLPMYTYVRIVGDWSFLIWAVRNAKKEVMTWPAIIRGCKYLRMWMQLR